MIFYASFSRWSFCTSLRTAENESIFPGKEVRLKKCFQRPANPWWMPGLRCLGTMILNLSLSKNWTYKQRLFFILLYFTRFPLNGYCKFNAMQAIQRLLNTNFTVAASIGGGVEGQQFSEYLFCRRSLPLWSKSI